MGPDAQASDNEISELKTHKATVKVYQNKEHTCFCRSKFCKLDPILGNLKGGKIVVSNSKLSRI